MVLRVLVPALLLLPCIAANAQIAFGGTPVGLLPLGPRLPEPQGFVLPAVDAAALIAEDEARIAAGIKGPWRFGFNHAVDARSDAHGTWTTLRNGDRVWRIAFTCPGAFSINFRFSRYVVPEGGRVFVYNAHGQWLGAFTAASAGGKRSMGVSQLPGERIIVEYHEPRAVAGQGELRIDRVTHAYRDVFRQLKDFGDSESCNINVICPEGDPWRDQIRSVAIITTGGSGFCTGTLLNNCAQDSTPYFLTANHCLDTDVENWVFRFNWDSPVCSPTENGPIDQTVANCVLLTSSSTTDMAFLQLSSVPPDAYNVFYSGWDKSGATPDSVCGIHHPSGDIKKISLSQSPISQANIDLGTGPADCWRVSVWDAGTTEPGSSGSGLWNQNKRLIGQLYGGAANCSNSVDDYYGRLDVSWPLLEPYLGACGDTLPGLGEVEVVVPTYFDAAITSIVNIPPLICGDSIITPIITLKNNGIVTLTNATITYGLVGGASNVFNWSGSLLPLQTANVQLPPLVAASGSQLLTVSSGFPNGNPDEVPENDQWTLGFNVSNPGGNVTLRLTLDNWGSDITWTLATLAGTVLYSGGPYPDLQAGVVIEAPWCLSNDCYIFTIRDAFGDGICCDEGEGSLEIVNADGTVLVQSDGQYGEEFTTVPPFCVEVVGVANRVLEQGLRLFPNPAAYEATVLLDGFGPRARVSLHDGTGRLVRALASNGQPQLSLSLEGLAPGVYAVAAGDERGRAVQRLMVRR